MKEQIEYTCSINTVHGVDHAPNCDGSCGYPKDNEEYGKMIIEATERGEDEGSNE